jgi:hypothetical protein
MYDLRNFCAELVRTPRMLPGLIVAALLGPVLPPDDAPPNPHALVLLCTSTQGLRVDIGAVRARRYGPTLRRVHADGRLPVRGAARPSAR